MLRSFMVIVKCITLCNCFAVLLILVNCSKKAVVLCARFIFCMSWKSSCNLIWAHTIKTDINKDISTYDMHIVTINSPLVAHCAMIQCHLLTDADSGALKNMINFDTV
jgi:hypothetical protein